MVGSLAVGACSGSGGGGSGGRKVTVYSGRTQNLIEPILNDFATETGIGVSVRYGQSADLALLIAEEGDKSPADVFLSQSPGSVGFLDARGLLGPLPDDVLTRVATGLRASDGHWVGFSGRKRVLVFNPEKLDWYNQQYLARLAPEELALRLRPLFESAGFWDEAYLGDRHAWFFAVIELLRPRVKRLTEFVDAGRYFFSDALEYDEAAVAKHLKVDGMAEHLAALDAAWAALEAFDAVSLEASLRRVAEARGLKAASLIHAVRVVLTGRSASPGLFDLAAFLGRARVHQRFAT